MLQAELIDITPGHSVFANSIGSAAAVTCESDGLWDALVEAADGQDAYFRPGYVRAYEKTGSGRAVAVIVTAEDSKFLVPLMVRPVSQEGGVLQRGEYDAATPYGYGGLLRLSGPGFPGPKTIEAFSRGLSDWCREQGIVSVLLRLNPLMAQDQWFASPAAGVCLMPYGPTVGLDLDAWDDERNRLKGLSKGRRADLNFALRGLRVSWASDEPGAIDAFLRNFRLIYEERMEELEAEQSYFFPPEYYAALASGLGSGMDVALAWCGNELVGGGIYMAGRQFAHAHLTGASEAGRHHRAGTMLINEAAKWGRRHGCRWLHLGGGKNGALFEYKKSFGGELFQYSFVGLIADARRYAELTAMRHANKEMPPPRPNFFPEYRA